MGSPQVPSSAPRLAYHISKVFIDKGRAVLDWIKKEDRTLHPYFSSWTLHLLSSLTRIPKRPSKARARVQTVVSVSSTGVDKEDSLPSGHDPWSHSPATSHGPALLHISAAYPGLFRRRSFHLAVSSSDDRLHTPRPLDELSTRLSFHGRSRPHRRHSLLGSAIASFSQDSVASTSRRALDPTLGNSVQIETSPLHSLITDHQPPVNTATIKEQTIPSTGGRPLFEALTARFSMSSSYQPGLVSDQDPQVPVGHWLPPQPLHPPTANQVPAQPVPQPEEKL